MARPNQEAIETYMSITGASEAVALLKLEEYGGNLNDAVNAHFTEGDGNITHSTSIPAAQDDVLVIDDPIPVESQGPRFPFLSSSETSLNPFSLLDPTFRRSFFDGRSTELMSSEPFVSLPREVREIPIEFKDGNNQSGNSGTTPTIEDITGTTYAHGPEIRGNVIVDDDDEEDDVDILTAPTVQAARQNERKDGSSGVNSHERRLRPRTRQLVSVNDDGNEIEEEMVQAVIEASKREVGDGYPKHPFGPPNEFGHGLQPRQSHLEDAELAHAVSLSLKTAKQEKAMREQDEVVEVTSSDVEELGKLTTENGRQGFGSFNKGSSSQIKLEGGSSSMQDEADDIEMLPLVRHRSRRSSSGSMKSVKDVEEMEDSPPLSPKPHDIGNQSRQNGDAFHSDEWGGISSEEHDEAVMLEAALFGGIPEGTSYRFAYPPHQLMQNSSDRHLGAFPWREPRPPSPTLEAQRLLREQQDDEYLAALQADREKELKATEEAEARHFEEKAARAAALEEERQKEEESRMKLLEEEEYERKLTAKESSLPLEPDSDDKNAVTLLVRMPDGSRRGRRFLKSDKLQSLFDFIDVGRVVKPGTYRLVRPYPRRTFSDGESELSLSELGLTSKQEALFLELI